MDYTTDWRDSTCRLNIKGTFTFSDNAKFREILSLLKDEKVAILELDLSDLQFIDSAALGMLLLLHDEAQKKQKRVSISGAQGQIKKMLQLSNFEEIFNISYS
ncbi:MAG: STAS domain-containing protein [Alphaproteobacteria bacterium]|nr:STAS domain-containing protein [Alphaproteobacteria bacterium]